MICIKNFIDFDEFKDFDSINKSNWTTIATSRKNISPFKKYLFKIFNFSCNSAKEQKIVLETFYQINNMKSQYLLTYKKLSLSYQSKLTPLFAMKFISSNTLEHALTATEFLSSLKMKNILNCIFAVSEAMRYLHDHLIYHGNLCPSNIIIDQVNQFYLCDYGLYPIKKLYIEEKNIFNSDYRDPYMRNKEPSYKSDIYSFGVLICQLFLTYFQVKGKSNVKQLTLKEFIDNQDMKKYQKFPKVFAELIPNCLNSDIRKRPSFAKIIDTFKTYKSDNSDIDISHLYDDFSKTNYLLKLSKTNESYILNKIGTMYDNEMNDMQKSMIFFKKAAEFDYSEAQSNYGVSLQDTGWKNKPDLKEGARMLRESAKQGNVHGMYNYGIVLSKGLGAEKNVKKAEKYLRRSADLGYKEAQSELGFLILSGDKLTPERIEEGLSYIKKAIDQNYSEAFAQYAYLLMNGKNVDEDCKLAMEYFKKAADLGHCESMIEYADGNMIGAGIPKNKEIALKYYKLAESNGVDIAKKRIEECMKDADEANVTPEKEKTTKKLSKKSNEDAPLPPTDKTQGNTIEKSKEKTKRKRKKKSADKEKNKTENDVPPEIQEIIQNEMIEELMQNDQSDFSTDESFESIIDIPDTKHKQDKAEDDISLKSPFKMQNKEHSFSRDKITKHTQDKPVSAHDEVESCAPDKPISFLKDLSTGKERPYIELPIQVSSQIKLISLGEIIYDETNYHTDKFIYPLGYQIEREYDSIENPAKKAIFRATVLRGINKPIFCVECLDKSGMTFKGTTPSQPWIEAYMEVENSKKEHGMPYKNIVHVNGLFNFGFTLLNVSYLIEKLPNANKCVNYVNKKLYLKGIDEKIIGGHEVHFINYEDHNEQNNDDTTEVSFNDEYHQFNQSFTASKDLQSDNEIESCGQMIDLDYPTDQSNNLESHKEEGNRDESREYFTLANTCSSFEEKLKYYNLAIQSENPISFSEWRSSILKYSSLTKDKEKLYKFAQLFEKNENFSDAAYLYKQAKDKINYQICYEKAKENIDSIKDGHQQYYFGILAKKENDLVIAKQLFEKADENKITFAKNKINEIKQMQSESAKKNPTGADFYAEIGIRYYEGTDGTKVSFQIAKTMLEEASRLGSPKADFYLGKYYKYQKGVSYMKKSAEEGYPDGQNIYAYYLQHGIYVEKNIEKALEFYKLAADQGHVEASYRYGYEIYNKSLTDEEKQIGISYIKKAAQKLYPDALWLYSKIISDTNPDDSKKFYEIALEKGSNSAREENYMKELFD